MKLEIVRPHAYLDIKIGDRKIGRVILEIYDDIAPKASANFLNLCKGSVVDQNQGPLSYKGNYFHRVIKNFVIQAGDVVNCKEGSKYANENYGKANISTLPEGLFGVENKDEPLDGPFKLCTANTDPDSNGSQFFISTYTLTHLTGKHTIFGRVKHGKSVVREVERVNTNDDNVPVEEEKVFIEDCGEWEEGMDIPIYNACYDQIGGDIYEEFPDDDEHIDKDSSELVYNASNIMKESGTLLLKQGRKQDALFKYLKCLRYVMEYIPDDEQEPQWFEKYYELKKKLYLNVALVYLQMKNYSRAIDYSSYLLDLDKATDAEKGKSYFRRGLSQAGLNKWDLALKDFKSAERLVPKDELIKKELKNAEAKLELQKKNQQAKYAKFFK